MTDHDDQDSPPSTLAGWQTYINAWAERKGWNDKVQSFGDICALFHTEVSEAYEDFRNNRGLTEIYFELNGVQIDDCEVARQALVDKTDSSVGLVKPCGIPIELADLIIRVLHFCAAEGIDLQAMIEMKMAYNEKRPYRHGGKAT
jgi:hypothetical protein